MAYNRNRELLRRTRTGDLRRVELRGEFRGIRPALVLVFNGEEERGVRHTNWLPFLNEHYVAQLMEPQDLRWAKQLAERAQR